MRCELAQKIGRLAPSLPRDAADKLARLTLDVLEKLAVDQLPRVRQIVADEVKHCDNLLRGLIRRLAMDAELAVAGPVLEYSPLLSDTDLLEIIDSDPVRGALGAVARRAALGEAVCEAIAESDDDGAIVDLLANKGAQIREETLDRLIDRAPPKEAWHTPLVRRGELSVRAVARIATFVSFSLLRSMEERNDLPSEAMTEVRKAVRERIEQTAAEPPRPAGDAKAAAAADDDSVQGAIERGDGRSVRAALAAKAKIAPEKVESILGSRSGKAVTALAWKAGFSMRTAVLIQRRIAGIPPDKMLNARDGIDFPLSTQELEAHFRMIA